MGDNGSAAWFLLDLASEQNAEGTTVSPIFTFSAFKMLLIFFDYHATEHGIFFEKNQSVVGNPEFCHGTFLS